MDSKDKETKMTLEQRGEVVVGGPSQEEAQMIRDQVGLSPQEVEKINQPELKPGSKVLKYVVDAASVGVAGIAGLAIGAKIMEAINTPAPIREEVKPDPKRDNPPSYESRKVVFPGNADGSAGSPQGAPVPDAPAEVEFKPTSKIFLPKVEKNHSEAPLRFLNKIERPDAKLTIFMDKEESVRRGGLFENLVEFRKRFGPSLPLEVYFYESLDELQRRFGNSSGIPWGQRIVEIIPYGAWASKANIYDDQGNYIETRQFPPAFEARGQIQYRVRDGQVVEVHVSLPKLLPGAQPDPLQIEQVEDQSQLNVIGQAFTLDENGKDIFSRDIRAAGQYLRTNPLYILKPNQRLDQVALYIVPW